MAFPALGITVTYNEQLLYVSNVVYAQQFPSFGNVGYTSSGLVVNAVDIRFSNTPIYFGLAAAFLLNGDIILDDTSVAAQVVPASTSTPEPASLLLLGAGLSGMAPGA